MKGNLNNIEDLFKQSFDGFEGNVDPSVWANVSQSIGAAGAGGAASGGLSVLAKSLIIGGSIAAATVVGVVIYSNSTEENSNNEESNPIIVQEEIQDPVIIVDQENDPVINENMEEIESELLNNENVAPDVDENTILFDHHDTHQNGSDQQVSDIVVEENPVDQNLENPIDQNDQNNPDVSVDENIEEPDQPEKLYPSGKMDLSATSVFVGEKILLTSNAKNYSKVVWQVGKKQLTGLSAEVSFAVPGKHTVRMMVYGQGEVYEETQEITVKAKSEIEKVPNVFTPNGDGINDVFKVTASEIATFYIAVADQNGRIIFESRDVNFTWDGTDMSGEKVEKGMFTYTIIAEGTDGAVYKIPGQVYVK